MKAAPAALRSLGLAVVLSSADIARAAAEKRAAEKQAAARANRAGRRSWSLPIADPRKRFGKRRRYVPARTEEVNCPLRFRFTIALIVVTADRRQTVGWQSDGRAANAGGNCASRIVRGADSSR